MMTRKKYPVPVLNAKLAADSVKPKLALDSPEIYVLETAVATQALGVIRDFFGASGQEAAGLSAQPLCTAMLRPTPRVGKACAAAALRAAVDSSLQTGRHRVA